MWLQWTYAYIAYKKGRKETNEHRKIEDKTTVKLLNTIYEYCNICEAYYDAI